MTAAVPPIHPRPEETAVRALLAAAGLPVANLTAAHLADFWGCGDGALGDNYTLTWMTIRP